MPWLGTFHSICAKMLRRHAELVGLQSNYTIIDTDDQLRLLKQLISENDLDEKRWPARQLAGLIDRWKNRGLGPQDLDAVENEAWANRSEEHTSELQSLMRISYAVFCLKKKNKQTITNIRKYAHTK